MPSKTIVFRLSLNVKLNNISYRLVSTLDQFQSLATFNFGKLPEQGSHLKIFNLLMLPLHIYLV